MSNYEAGKLALEKILEDLAGVSQDRNEASTRFHIIDRLLSEVLGWPREKTEVEVHQEGQYSDYQLGRPPILLVEAKREGRYFELPSGWDKPTVSLQTLFDFSTEVESAVRQAVDYCAKRGIPYGTVCNGRQLLAFVASRKDGTPPIKGRALAFPSPQSMYDRFPEFWDALSPHGASEGNLDRILGAELLPTPPEKLSRRVPSYPGYKNRNPVATELNILGGLFIEDLARDPELEEEFLEQTYCRSGALSQYSLVSREILRARYATFFEKEAEVSDCSSRQEGLVA